MKVGAILLCIGGKCDGDDVQLFVLQLLLCEVFICCLLVKWKTLNDPQCENVSAF